MSRKHEWMICLVVTELKGLQFRRLFGYLAKHRTYLRGITAIERPRSIADRFGDAMILSIIETLGRRCGSRIKFSARA